MGPISKLAGMIPGVNAKALEGAQVDEKQMARTEAIIRSMTPKERENPHIMDASRKRRVAAGSGTQVQDVNRLLKQFDDMQKLMKQFNNPNFMKKNKKFRGLF